MLFENQDVTVVDLTHGGIPLALNIAQFARGVTGIDVYGTVDSVVLTGLEKDGIEISKTIQSDTDLIVAPVHLDPDLLPDSNSNEIITHHRAVGEILLNTDMGAKVIEITGTGAKTSTATLLADMMSRQMSVISHTSRGVEQWQNGAPEMVHHGLSIAPGSILEALEYTRGINPDLYIFEISLGGTGAADLGIITSLDNEYTIAGGSRSSSMAKKQIIDYAKQGSTLLINANAGEIDLPNNIKSVSFSDTSKDAEFSIDNSKSDWIIRFSKQTFRFAPNTGYDPNAYTTAIICATAASTLMGVSPETIESTLSEFHGVNGRMQVVKHSGRIMLDNSNSGMNPASLEHALEYSRNISENNSKRVYIIGEEAEQVCEGLDPEAVNTFVSEHDRELDNIILVGERMHAITGDNIQHAGSLKDAIGIAESLTLKNDMIISCVKCFR
ncbi:MAG: coenzyme F430 synthase [Methanosarcinales archaeon]|nr:coenzyme F430 synthase [Methanosarcinales archaeon]